MKILAVLPAALVAAGCACAPVTPALFVVVPAADGHIGKIVVHRGRQAITIDSAYGGQRLRGDGRVEPTRLSENEVRQQFGPVMAALPGRPASFMLYFLEGKDELTESSKAELDKVFAELRLRPLPDIMVIGHTDTVGGDEYNDKLSLARAEKLRELLVARGLPEQRIQVAGRGERELLVPTADDTPEPRNRRVEISVR